MVTSVSLFDCSMPTEEEKAAKEEKKAAFESLTRVIKDILGDRIEKVRSRTQPQFEIVRTHQLSKSAGF